MLGSALRFALSFPFPRFALYKTIILLTSSSLGLKAIELCWKGARLEWLIAFGLSSLSLPFLGI